MNQHASILLKFSLNFTQGLLKQFRYRNSDTLAIDAKVDEKEVGQYVLTCCTYPKSNLLLKLQGEVNAFDDIVLFISTMVFMYRMKCMFVSGLKVLKVVEFSGAGEPDTI
jgi:hypothetical protein